MSGPITKPIAFTLLEALGIKKNAGQFVTELDQRIAPVMSIEPYARVDNITSEQVTIAANFFSASTTIFWTNNTGGNVIVRRAQLRSALAMGAGLIMFGYMVATDSNNIANALVQISDNFNFGAGNYPSWCTRFTDSEVLLLGPGGSIGMWLSSYVAPSPAFVAVIEYQILQA